MTADEYNATEGWERARYASDMAMLDNMAREQVRRMLRVFALNATGVGILTRKLHPIRLPREES